MTPTPDPRDARLVICLRCTYCDTCFDLRPHVDVDPHVQDDDEERLDFGFQLIRHPSGTPCAHCDHLHGQHIPMSFLNLG